MTIERIVALHGFLGLPADWDPVFHGLRARLPGVETLAVDLWPMTCLSMEDAAAQIDDLGSPQTLVLGYSMGGRLAACVMAARQTKFYGALVISAHPGGLPAQEAATRLEGDRAWARRFAQDPWERLMADWNALPVFSGGGLGPVRWETDFHRPHLAAALEHWSVARQIDTMPGIRRSGRPVVWMAGSADSRYVRVAQRVAAQCETVEARIVDGTGHRLLHHAPWAVAEAIANRVWTMKPR